MKLQLNFSCAVTVTRTVSYTINQLTKPFPDSEFRAAESQGHKRGAIYIDILYTDSSNR